MLIKATDQFNNNKVRRMGWLYEISFDDALALHEGNQVELPIDTARKMIFDGVVEEVKPKKTKTAEPPSEATIKEPDYGDG